MSTVLDIFRASAGKDLEIPTLELTCPVWGESLFLCAGFKNFTFIDENGRVLTFEASGIDVTLPKRSNDGGQSLGLAIDNVRGKAQQLIDLAKHWGARITIIYRTYLESDPTAPAEQPLRLTALSATMEGPTVQILAGYFDLVNAAWPRDRYTAVNFPGIKYIS